MRQIFLRTVAAAALSLVASVATAQEGSLALWSFIDPAGEGARSEALKQVIARFEAENAGTTVNTNVVEWNEIVPSLMRAAQAGQTPDIAMVYSPSLPSLIGAGAIVSLEECFSQTWSPEDRSDVILLSTGKDSAGAAYGVPYELRVFGFFYRSDLLEKAGVAQPTSFDELVAAAKQVAGTDLTPLGMTFNAGGGSVEAIEWFVPMVTGMGAKILNDDGSAAFNQPQVVQLLERLKQLVDDGTLPNDVVLSTPEAVEQLAQSGRIAFIAEGSQEASSFQETATDGVTWAYMPPPGMEPGTVSPAALNGWNLVIPKAAKNPDAACKLIKTWTSADAQREQTLAAGYLPVRESLGTDPALQTPENAHVPALLTYAKNNPLAFTWPENTDLLNDALSDMIQKVITGQAAPADAIAAAEASYNSRRIQ